MAIMPGEVVRVRRPRRALALPIALLTVYTALSTAVVWLSPDPFWSGWPRASWVVVVVAFAAVVADVVLRPTGMDLRDDVAVVVGPLRSREVPWGDVQAVAFGEHDCLRLYLADRTEVRCIYPSNNNMFVSWERIQADYHRVGQWWLAHRGADWRPVLAPLPYPPTAPRPVEELWRTPPEAQG